MIGILVLSVFVIPAFAKGTNGQAGKSNKAHLNFYEKDSNTWEIIQNGAFGTMTYDLTGETFNYVFNGHGLTAGDEYELIYYPDPWPGEGLLCLGSGIANEDGDVHLKSSVDTGNLPNEDDENKYLNPNITGTWDVDLSGHIRQFKNLVQDNDGNITGGFLYKPNVSSNWLYGGTLEGTIKGNTIELFYERPETFHYTGTFIGKIDKDGMSGTFTDSHDNTYEWNTDGSAIFSGGAKIWLVLSEDITCEGLNGTWKQSNWNPTEYLFEDALITFIKK